MKRRLVVGGVVALVFVGAILSIVLTGGSPKHTAKPKHFKAAAHLATNRCPLTDLPAPNGQVPSREALAVKIGNEPGSPGARPQTGLNEADIVYDTPAEGGLQRFIAIYQCENVANLGPVRSVRLDDFHLLSSFGQIALGFVGGDNPNQAIAASTSWIDDANQFVHASAFHLDPNRTAPDSTYTTTAALWGLFGPHPAPRPVFTYTKALPTGAQPAAALGINFSAGTDVIWKWNSATAQWDHTYSGVADIDALNNEQVSATNIIVQVVKWAYGNDVDHAGHHDVVATVLGSGPGFVFRNGEEIPVTWHRVSSQAPTTFTDHAGKSVGLAPGRTWIEIVLNTTYAVKGDFSITP